MAKRKKNKPTQSSNTHNLDNVTDKVNELQKVANISDNELSNSEDVTVPSGLKVNNIETVYKHAVKIKDQLETRKIEYSKKLSDVDEQTKTLEEETKEYEVKKIELDESIRKYDQELQEINQLRAGNFANIIDKKVIDKYSQSLEEQKEILIEIIEKLKEEQIHYLTLAAEKEKEILGMQTKLVEEKIELQKQFQSEFDNKNIELEQSKRKIKKLKQQLEYDIEDFKDEKEYLVKKAKKSVEEELIRQQETISLLEHKNSLLIEEIEKLKEIHRYFGGRDPKKIIDELNEAKDEIYNLQGKLELSPDSLDIDELKKLRQEKVDWKVDLEDALANVNEYRQRWEREQLSIGEKETLEFQKEELTKRIELQQIALDEFQKVLDKSNSQEVFSSCIKMDEEYTNKENLNLANMHFSKQWIDTLQQKLFDREVSLRYDADILRSYVAGLAMSRLTILQGISGTGKTSLAEAFTQTIGGYSETIEVQSGWKDRQDLIGYYNTFEKKFYESDFLKALYKANTPKYRDKPFFIILDEMNLSHPEHYFADLLSLMEKTNRKDQTLKICDETDNKPKFMENIDGTFKLQIPDNVWFIGTANHDETTLQFAPKTYDRANVIEMPKNHIVVNKKNNIDLDYILTDNESLLTNFSLSDEEDMISFNEYLSLDGNFKSICNKLGLGWGNRLEKQMKSFIPIFIQLGGTEANAMDQIISSKILRNIQGRYDLQSDELKKMKEELETNFVKFFNGKAKKCLEIVNQEIAKK